jgi:hypothetical protein
MAADRMVLDTVIFGGGAAGLWLLDELSRRGIFTLLLEAGELGGGQTVASQGILHGGTKYSLQGLLTGSATSIRHMPLLWSACLAGAREPDLSATRIRAEYCHLWRTDSVSSKLGMLGAKIGLSVAPQNLDNGSRPDVLAECPGQVARLDEQVIAPHSLIADLSAKHIDRILRIDSERGLSFELDGPGKVRTIRLLDPRTSRRVALYPKHIVFAAGAGNADLRERVGLTPQAMQRRPLHMVLVRGDLPVLNGHCVDGAKTRATITTDNDIARRTVWQIGGQIAEDGVALVEPSLIAHARRELEYILPGIDLAHTEWATYRIDRAEGATPNGARPENVQLLSEGNVVTAWPTKLVLAPVLAERIIAALQPLVLGEPAFPDVPPDWPRPSIARPPWEMIARWHRIDSAGHPLRKVA